MHPQTSPIAQYRWNRCTGIEQKVALSVGRVPIELVTVDIDFAEGYISAVSEYKWHKRTGSFNMHVKSRYCIRLKCGTDIHMHTERCNMYIHVCMTNW